MKRLLIVVGLLLLVTAVWGQQDLAPTIVSDVTAYSEKAFIQYVQRVKENNNFETAYSDEVPEWIKDTMIKYVRDYPIEGGVYVCMYGTRTAIYAIYCNVYDYDRRSGSFYRRMLYLKWK